VAGTNDWQASRHHAEWTGTRDNDTHDNESGGSKASWEASLADAVRCSCAIRFAIFCRRLRSRQGHAVVT
jgi:hypothetical protein